MITNYYTLRHLAHDLDNKLAGAVVLEVFCQDKQELTVSLQEGQHRSALLISCAPSVNFVLLRGEVHRAKKNSVDVLKGAWGTHIERIFIQPADREILLQCSTDRRVILQLFGSKANVLLVDRTNRIVDAFLHPRKIVGTEYQARVHDPQNVPQTVDEFQAQLQTIGNILLSVAVKKLFPLLNSILIREICHRAELGDRQLVAELHEEDQHRLHRVLRELLGQLEGPPSPRMYHRKSLPPVFSIVLLGHIAAAREETFHSLHDGIKTFLATSRKEQSLLEEKQRLVHFLEQGIGRAERTLQKIAAENEVLARAAQYELFGKLLMANLNRVEPRRKQVDAENVFVPTRPVETIPLEPSLSPAKNAERYFEKAKKARASIEEKTKHREQTEGTWEELHELLRQASCIQTTEQIADFLTDNADRLAGLGYSSPTRESGQERGSVPFRTFVVTGGFTVWVGKSSENNDLLTMKYARPNDLWFHARGSSGSHVVLKVGTGRGEPSRKAVDEAASIAAYYSKMKTAKHVPVAMTRRKYVRKRRGAAPGTVTIERERLLFVEPGLPNPVQ